jgi:hypothetical protein
MAIYESLKDAAKVLQEAGKIEQYKQILEVQEKLLEMQKSILDLTTENKELREKLNIKENLICEGNEYWILKEGGKKDGPFCTNCWDVNNKLVRLHISPTYGSVTCPNCKTVTKHGRVIIT